MRIYTRTGDDGDTGLADGSRTSKASARVEAYGTIDEANSAVGLARCAVTDKALDATLQFVQQRLFNCSSALAKPQANDETPPIFPADIAVLEGAIDQHEAASDGFRGFVLPAGCEAASRLHLARTIVRRAERRAVALASEAEVDPTVLAFLNRLSDLLFAAARAECVRAGAAEDIWDADATPPVV
jgi:cob(I)alamin adenosyltransferase